MSHNENITLNINHLKRPRLQNGAFLFLYDSVNNRSKMEQGPAITVPDARNKRVGSDNEESLENEWKLKHIR